MVHQNPAICIWMKRYVIPFVTLSFWIISLYSEIHGILQPVLFRCYHRNKEVVARDRVQSPMGVLRGGTEQWRRRFQIGCTRISLPIGRSVSLSFNGDATLKFTGGRLEEHHTI